VGNIVTHRRQQYTALGDAVNLASRLQTATKDLKAILVVSGEARDEAEATLGERVEFRDRGTLAVRGRERPVRVFEVLRAEAGGEGGRRHDEDRKEAVEALAGER